MSLSKNNYTVDQTYNDDMLELMFDKIGVQFKSIGATFTHTEMSCLVELMPTNDLVKHTLSMKLE